MEHLTCRASGAEYGFRLDRVRGIVPATPPTRVPGAPPALRGLVAHRGNPLPVLDLAVRLGGAEAVLGRRSCLLLLDASFEGETLLLGVLVDAVERLVSSEAHRFPLPPALQALEEPRICAGFVQAEGALVPLLDPDQLLARGPLWRARPPRRPRLPAAPAGAAGEGSVPSRPRSGAPLREVRSQAIAAAPPLPGEPAGAVPSATAAPGAPVTARHRGAPASRPAPRAVPGTPVTAPDGAARAVRPFPGAMRAPAGAAVPVEVPAPPLAAAAGAAPGWRARPPEQGAAPPGAVAGPPETLRAGEDGPGPVAAPTPPGPAAARWIWRGAVLLVAAACLALLVRTLLGTDAPTGGPPASARGRGEGAAVPAPPAAAPASALPAGPPAAAAVADHGAPLPAPPPETAAVPEGWVMHEVRKGDSLWALSGRLLGNPRRWPEIFERNRGLVQDPDLIYPRQRIVIPGAPGAAQGAPPP